jgi:trigger factor
MQITKEQKDALNAIVTINIEKADYHEKVERALSDYRRKAKIKGFRPGHVPMAFIRQQYQQSVLMDTINKLLQDNLGKYMTDQKLDVLGNPLPLPQNNLDWEQDDFSFKFELGLAPQFEVKLNAKKVTQYQILADDVVINRQLDSIQKQYGKLTSTDKIEKETEISVDFTSEDETKKGSSIITLEQIKGKSNQLQFKSSKVGDVLTLKTKGLFENDQDLRTALAITSEEVNGLNIEITATITALQNREKAEMNQELFDKLFGPGVISSVTELKDRIKIDAEKQFAQQSDQKLLNDVIESLIDNTKFKLPADFLKRWMQQSGEKPLSAKEATVEYDKSEKGIRYQLIEGKLIEDYGLQVKFEEIQAYAKDRIKMQMAQFGQNNPTDKELNDIAARVLGNKDEVKRIADEVLSQKMLELFKKEANLKLKALSYDKFIKEVS